MLLFLFYRHIGQYNTHTLGSATEHSYIMGNMKVKYQDFGYRLVYKS